jgi:hypothetical protein
MKKGSWTWIAAAPDRSRWQAFAAVGRESRHEIMDGALFQLR